MTSDLLTLGDARLSGYDLDWLAAPGDDMERMLCVDGLIDREKLAADEAMAGFEGYASTGDVDSYGDVIRPDAWRKSLQGIAGDFAAIPMLFNHELGVPVGTWTSLKTDKTGLYAVGAFDMDEPREAQLARNVRRGTVRAMSVGFRLRDYAIVEDPADKSRKIVVIKDADLREISLVNFPANTKARIMNTKSLEMSRSARPSTAQVKALKDQLARLRASLS